ncbi:hypothetical protein MASR1M49_41240 [Pararhodobacter aggregans]
MSDLDKLIAEERWHDIALERLSDAERGRLASHLERILPRIRRGDGFEVYTSAVRPHETQSDDEEAAATLLERLYHWGAFDTKSPQAIYAPAAELAKSFLDDQFGIEFTDWDTTFIYPTPSGGWVTVRPDIAEALLAKRYRLFHNPENWCRQDPERLFHAEKAWRKLYPWRNVERIGIWWRGDAFGEFTAADHALHILNLVRFGGGAKALRDVADDPERFAVEFGLVVETAFRIGIHYDALQKKPAEHLAVQKLNEKVRARLNGNRGGQGSKRQERIETLNRLALRRAHDFAFISDAQAVRLARSIAAEHDKSAPEPLFWQGGKPLSLNWFQNWASDFRAALSNAEKTRR